MRRLMWSSCFAFVVSGVGLGALAGCQGAEIAAAPVAAQAAPIVAGTEDHGDPAIVLISWTDPTGSFLCTGALIAPKVILTARHCVRDEEGDLTPVPQGAHKVSFHTGWSDDPHAFVPTTGFAAMPGAKMEYGTDIAVLFLKDPAPAGITPLPISTFAGALGVGQALRLAGFGITSSDQGNSAGVKRTGQTFISALEEEHVRHNLNPSGTCEGDSGGPQLVKLGDVEVIAGVTSNGTIGCLGDHDAVRVDSHLAFIKQYADIDFDKVAPEVTIKSPADGSGVAAGFQVEADITDNHGVLSAALFIDNTPVNSDLTAPWVLKAPTNVTVGVHKVEVVGTDVFGNVTKKAIMVDVKPSCAIDSDCADGQACVAGVCGAPIGADCESGAQCATGQCYHTTDDGSFCTMNCTSASECPSGFDCAASGVSPVTKCIAGSSSGGCIIGSPGRNGGRAPIVAALLMVGMLLGVRISRRRR
jgi:hypothetical protein